MPVVFRLAGPLNVDRLRAALWSVVERHRTLRTTLHLTSSGPVQHVAPRLDLLLSAEQITPERLDNVLTLEARRPFDLTTGPPLRTRLWQMTPEDHVLMVTTHHSAIDGQSLEIFEHDLLAFYRGDDQTLPPLPIHYTDYATWQADAGSDAEYRRGLAYWREVLKAPLPVLALPSTRPRPATLETDGETVSTVFDQTLIDRLAKRGREQGATLFMVMLAAYAVVLSRTTGQHQLIIGTPVANRTFPETEHMVGYFANTVALSLDLSGSPTIDDLVRRVRDVCTAAYAHQDIPFDALVEQISVDRDPSRTPIFQTLFGFEDAMAGGRAEPKPTELAIVKRETVHAKVARTDLSAWVSVADDGVAVTLEYLASQFDGADMRRLLGHYGVMMEALAAGAVDRIDRLPILTSAEVEEMDRWNPTPRPLPGTSGVHALFSQQAARTPDRIAIATSSRSMSYAALERRSNQLAHHLRRRGVGRHSRVGICLDRSERLVVAVLGVLKAGAAYVPLDPMYPRDRLAFMVSDTGMPLVVTETGVREQAPLQGMEVVLLDDEAAWLAAEPYTGPNIPTDGDDLAYVIYTSGSTGTPKGVAVPHRSVVNFLTSMGEQPGLAADDVMLAVTTLSFDISVLELLLPLVVGARVVVVDAKTAADGKRLAVALEASGATVMQATPTTWQLLFESGWTGNRNLRVLCGGEPLSPSLAERLLKTVRRVWNMYGPTETTVWSTCGEVKSGSPVTVGRPIANTQVYVLDTNGQAVPVGVTGEVYIGGEGVTAGYLNRDELTRERFVPDPFSPVPARRLYRTGDLARWSPEGELVHLGRADRQQKIRGHRIELGEVEAVLGRCPAVHSGVVETWELGEGDVRLVAYIVPATDDGDPSGEVRQFLRETLPAHMVPGLVLSLPTLPRTSNGKVDRAALPSPTRSTVPDERTEPPQGPTEVAVAKIWRDVLGVEHVGRHDNFFDLGGHSLLVMRAIARLEHDLGVCVAVQEFIYQTVEQLAALCNNKKAFAPTHAEPTGRRRWLRRLA